MERALIGDPKYYEAKPIAGKTDARGLVTIVVVCIVVAPFAWAIWNSLLDAYVGALLAAVPASVVGFIGLKSHKGMHAEEFLPIVIRERRRPREMTWQNPVARDAGQEEPQGGGHETPGRRGRRLRQEREEAWEDHVYALSIARDANEEE